MRGLYTQNQITQAAGGSSLAGKNRSWSPDVEQISLEKYVIVHNMKLTREWGMTLTFGYYLVNTQAHKKVSRC